MKTFWSFAIEYNKLCRCFYITDSNRIILDEYSSKRILRYCHVKNMSVILITILYFSNIEALDEATSHKYLKVRLWLDVSRSVNLREISKIAATQPTSPISPLIKTHATRCVPNIVRHNTEKRDAAHNFGWNKGKIWNIAGPPLFGDNLTVPRAHKTSTAQMYTCVYLYIYVLQYGNI